MKSIKKITVVMIGMLLVIGCITQFEVEAGGIRPKKVYFTTTSKTVFVGEEFELFAKMNAKNADDDYLVWSISKGKGIIRFDDDDRTGDDMEFRAVKAGTATVKCKIRGTKKYATMKVVVKEQPVTDQLERVGKATRTVEVDDDIELKVIKPSGLHWKKLKWTIKDTSILRFDDQDCYGREVEVEGLRVGKTKVVCKNLATGDKIVFTIEVVAER